MKLTLRTGLAAAALFAGATGAQAGWVYVADPPFPFGAPPFPFGTPPGYVYSVPAPIQSPGYVVTDPGYTVVAEPPAVVVAPPPARVGRPMVVAPRVVPAQQGIVTTGYSTTRCFIDLRGIERCY